MIQATIIDDMRSSYRPGGSTINLDCAPVFELSAGSVLCVISCETVDSDLFLSLENVAFLEVIVIRYLKSVVTPHFSFAKF